MNDIRRSILWVIFGFSMILLWDRWQIHNGNPATFFPSFSQEAKTTTSQATGNTLPTASGQAATAVTSGAVATTTNTSASAAAASTPVAAVKSEVIEFKTDLLKLRFDTAGGSIVYAEFLNHKETGSTKNNVLLFDKSSNRNYVAQSGLRGAGYPNHAQVMTLLDGPRSLESGQNNLVVKFESPELGGLKLIKTYTFTRGSYAIAVKHEVQNLGSTPVNPELYVQLVRDGNKLPGESSFYSTFTGPAVYTEAKHFQKVEFTDIKKDKATYEKEATNGYVAMVQHYFASAWILPDNVKRTINLDGVALEGVSLADCCYRATMIAPMGLVAPGAKTEMAATLFAGPQEEKKIEEITPGLGLVKDYGWFAILAKPLYALLHWLHTVINNWGWSIIALVVLLKAAFYWFNAKAYSSMAKMKAVGPRIQAMRERLKDKPQEMQQEMMKIYREEKVNPLGGCFPMLIQIPVFIALYWVLLSSVEIRNAPWILWIHDLSAPDPYFILPFIMTLTSLLQTALNPVPPDPMQAKLMWFMPLAFSVMFFFFPAGLVLYWITNNTLSIIQQWIINVRMGVPPQFNLPKFK
jgi:YidC/Oxa1 family membrane protein insertase